MGDGEPAGIRSQRTRLLWQTFGSAKCAAGTVYVLRRSTAHRADLKTRESDGITFKQVATRDSPQQVAEVLNRFAADRARRERLPSWDA